MATEIDALQLNIGAESTDAAKSIDSLKTSLSGLLKEVEKASSLNNLAKQLQGVKQATSGSPVKRQATAAVSDWNYSGTQPLWTDRKTGETWNKKQMDYWVNFKRQAQQMQVKMQPDAYATASRMEAALAQDALRQEATAAMENATAHKEAAAAENTKATADNTATNSAKGATRELKNQKSALQALKSAAHDASRHGLGRLITQFGRMLRMRAVRATIRGLINSFKEGYNNLYGWSKYMGGSFASSIDSARNSLSTMKNALGTAIAPVIQAALPYVQQLVSWIREASNTLSQFFAILQGKSTWTKAKDVTADQMNKVKKEAKDASSAVHEMLAGFDELNVIQSESKSGNTGDTNYAAYKDLYEEVSTFDEGVVEWANKLKPILEWVKENFDKILLTVGGIKLGLAAWKIASGLLGSTGLGGVSTTLSKIAGILAGIAISEVSIKFATDISPIQFVKSLIDDIKENGFENWGKSGRNNVVNKALLSQGWSQDKIDKMWASLGVPTEGTIPKAAPPTSGNGIAYLFNSETNKLFETVNKFKEALGFDGQIGNNDNSFANFLKNKYQKPLEEALENGKSILKKAGVDAENILNNWDLVAPLIESQGVDESAKRILSLINIYGKDWISHLDKIGLDTVSTLKGQSRQYTDVGKTLPEGLAKGIASSGTYKTALHDMLATTNLTIGQIKTIVNDTKLTAPIVETYGYEGSIEKIRQIAQTGGFNTRRILENWDLIAPMINENNMVASLTEINRLIDKYGKGWQNHLDELNLKTEVSVEEKPGWFETLKNKIQSVLNSNAFKAFAEIVTNNSSNGSVSGLTTTVGSVTSSSGSTTSNSTAAALNSWNPFSGSTSSNTSTTSSGLLSFKVKDTLSSLQTLAPKVFKQAYNLKTDKGKEDSKRIEVWNLTKDEVAWLQNNGYTIPKGYLHEKTKKGIRQIRQFAAGGFPASGQLFLARERGAELVGEMNGHTAVANNEQIIEGVSRGVERANNEQNRLLREVAQLLTAIYQKDTSLKLTPSAALGRIVAQSEQMYGAVVG